MIRWTAAIAAALLVAALAIGALPAEKNGATLQERVASYRADAADLVRKQGEAGWKTWVEGEPADQASLYRQYAHLFTRETIADTAALIEKTSDPETKRALTFFKLYLEAEYVGNGTATLDDIYADLEANLWATVDGKRVRYRELGGILANTADKARREKIADEEYRAYETLNNVVLGRILDTSHRLATELGYDSYTGLAAAYRMIDADALATQAEKFLDGTEAMYLALFDEASPIPRETFRRSDTLFVLGGKEYDAYFPAEKLVPAVDAFLRGIGINRASQIGLTLDDRDLPNKVPRAVCFSIEVPGDVRLSIKPAGGKDDYSSLFHEMGHGQHFANTTTPVWEFQQLGSNAVTETYAYLFEYLTETPAWVKQNTGMRGKDLRRFARYSAFCRLYMARRYAAKFLYELALHRGAGEPKALYRKLMSRAYGYELTEREATRYLSDVDPFLYSADYVQAFFLEAMLTKELTTRFGKAWWKNRQAGEYLKELFAKGNRMTGGDLARELGYDGVDASVLNDNLNRMIPSHGPAQDPAG